MASLRRKKSRKLPAQWGGSLNGPVFSTPLDYFVERARTEVRVPFYGQSQRTPRQFKLRKNEIAPLFFQADEAFADRIPLPCVSTHRTDTQPLRFAQ